VTRLGASLLLCLFGAGSAPGAPPLSIERTTPLVGVEGRIDHLFADVKGNRLFVAALGNSSVQVLDLKAGNLVKSIGDLKEPQGVLYIPDVDLLYVATGGDGAVRIFDATSFKLLRTIEFGDDADNIRFDRNAKRIYVGYGAGALAAFDENGNRQADIPLRAHPESFQIEKNGPRIFVNVPDAKEVGVVDAKRNAVIAKWSTGSSLANFPMALDETSRRLFVVCRAPARLLALDMDSGKIVAKIETVDDSDDVFYDASKRRIYVSGGGGAVRVYAQRDANTYEQIGRIPTAPGARTSLFVPEMNELFLAVPHRGQQKAEIRVYRSQ
jgi:hypothetical protein